MQLPRANMKNYSKILFEITKKFSGTSYDSLVNEARKAYLANDYKLIDEIYLKLPDNKALLAKLIEKNKDKPVYSNLKKIFKGESVLKEDKIIAISSLITRTSIEAKESKEFNLLIPDLLLKLNEIVKE